MLTRYLKNLNLAFFMKEKISLDKKNRFITPINIGRNKLCYFLPESGRCYYEYHKIVQKNLHQIC